MADREVTCAEISMRGKNQWQSGGERQRTWTSQKIKTTERSWGTQDPMTGGTEMITLQEVAEMQKQKG